MTVAGDATMSVARANLLAILWLPLSALLVFAPFMLLWGAGPIAAAFPAATRLSILLPLLLIGVLAHEALHAAGFLLFGRAPRAAVRLGFQRRTLTPFASCSAAVPAGAYRGAALLPGVVLGLVPAAAAWATGSGFLALWGWLMLAVAAGDLAAVWAIRRLPRGTLVLDHPSRVGCVLAAP